MVCCLTKLTKTLTETGTGAESILIAAESHVLEPLLQECTVGISTALKSTVADPRLTGKCHVSVIPICDREQVWASLISCLCVTLVISVFALGLW